jgi:Predicted choloylglycine hydrolase
MKEAVRPERTRSGRVASPRPSARTEVSVSTGRPAAKSQKTRPRRFRRWLAAAAAILIADWLLASAVLWRNYALARKSLATGTWLLPPGSYRLDVTKEADGKSVERLASLRVATRDGYARVDLNYEGLSLSVVHADRTQVTRPGAPVYSADPGRLRRAAAAIQRVEGLLPRPTVWQAALGTVVAHPFLVGPTFLSGGRVGLLIRHQYGRAVVGFDGGLRRWDVRVPDGKTEWVLRLRSKPTVESRLLRGNAAQQVALPELDRSLAAAVSIFALQFQPVPQRPDAFRRVGKGWLRIVNGRRILHLEGGPYEMGYQHGKLLADSIRRLVDRLVYGVGLEYSLSKGRWFLAEARRLVERQRPYIDPAYFEEMRGLAQGSGVPLAEIQAANIFPEFFHCSGVAVFGAATSNGELLHARVLDYMTEVGLQDEAVVMAFAPRGRHRWVNVGYAGFIGSVTGMNEAKVAIGEMGGGGEGWWDGTPMSFLVRGALEHCDNLEDALRYMRERPRTCEYFYVISDGKSRTAAGVAATPRRFQVVRPGETMPLLPERVPDAVLLSAGDRYRELVKRVRQRYGGIDVQELLEIIKRPVAMSSNLHNAVFAPERLTLWVNNASRHDPACNQPAAEYRWQDLFGSPSQG